jgi:hypothetical protein
MLTSVVASDPLSQSEGKDPEFFFRHYLAYGEAWRTVLAVWQKCGDVQRACGVNETLIVLGSRKCASHRESTETTV